MARTTRAAGLGSPFQNIFPIPEKARRDPKTSDKNFEIGQVWVNILNSSVWILSNVSSGDALWIEISGALQTLTPDTGGPISPIGGNIFITGGDNLNTVGTLGDVTFNLDTSLQALTSVSSALYTAATGADVNIMAPTGQNIVQMLGDAAGVTKLSVTDSASAELFSVDSNGSTIVLGPFTQSPGNVNIAADNGTSTVNIGTGSGNRTINLGTGTGPHTISVGSNTTTSSLSLRCGIAGMTVESRGGYTLNATGAAINIGNDAFVQPINIGTGAVTREITLGSNNAATSIDLNVGTGGVRVGTNPTDHASSIGGLVGASPLSLNSGTGAMTATAGGALSLSSVGAVQVNSSAAAIQIGNNSVPQDIDIGTAGSGRDITIGNNFGATSVALTSGTGNISFNGTIEEVNTKQFVNSGFNIILKSSPLTCTAANTGGVATGANGNINLLGLANGIVMEQFIIGTQTIIKPVMVGNGLLFSLDSTVGEGAEYNFGAQRSLCEFSQTIGTSPAFFFEVKVLASDVSGSGPYFIGFRTVQFNESTFSNYTDQYGIGLNSATSTTNVVLTSQLNGGGQTLQDSGDAWPGGDNGSPLLRVNVSATGVVTTTIDGSAPTSPLAYTFDNAQIVCPYIHFVHSADTSLMHLVSMKGGLQ